MHNWNQFREKTSGVGRMGVFTQAFPSATAAQKRALQSIAYARWRNEPEKQTEPLCLGKDAVSNVLSEQQYSDNEEEDSLST